MNYGRLKITKDKEGNYNILGDNYAPITVKPVRAEIEIGAKVDPPAPWLHRCNPVHPGSTFPKNRHCFVCGETTKEDYFTIQFHDPDDKHDYIVVHLKCFENGEFKYNHRNRMIFWMHSGG